MGCVLRRKSVKRIGLFIGASATDGGVFQYSRAVLETMARATARDHSVVVLYLDPAWEAIVAPHGVEHKLIPRGALVRYWDAFVRRLPLPVAVWRRTMSRTHSITRALAAQRCDLWVFPAQDMWAYLAPVPALATIHDLMHRYEARFPEVSGRGMYRARERHYMRTCLWARGILVDSEVGRRQVMESYQVDETKLFVVPYIASSHVRATRLGDCDWRSLPSKFFFYPAQFWQHKNHNNLIHAIAALRERHSDVRLVLVGSKKNGYASVRDQVTALGLDEHVIFLGYVPDADMPEMYRRARAMVMPTFFGPTNIPPLEAFALGCPVAVSRIYGIPEQVGDAALLFDPNSVDDIAAVLEHLWTDDDLCKVLAERGRARDMSWGAPEFAHAVDGVIRFLVGAPSAP